MKIVQTFWTGNYDFDNRAGGLDFAAGWLSSEYHWMSWSYSCYQLLKLHAQVELVTDEKGKALLIDTLGLPYTSVSLALEEESATVHPKLFAMAKMKTYSLQTTPFVHVDGDLFLFQPFQPQLLEAPIIASNPEADLYFNESIVKAVHEQGFWLPDHLKPLDQVKPLYSSNAGIIGGNDLDLIQEYCQLGFEFVERNFHLLDRVKTRDLNFLIEQVSLFYLAQQRQVPTAYVSPEPVTDPLYEDFINFANIPKVTMVHAVGGCKKSPFMLAHLARRFRQEYPDQYYRIISLCKDSGLPIHNRFYERARVSFSQTEGPLVDVHKNGQDKPPEETYESQYWRTLRATSYARPKMGLPGSALALANIMASNELPPQCTDVFGIEQLLEKEKLEHSIKTDLRGRYLADIDNYASITDSFGNGQINELDFISVAPLTSLAQCNWNWWRNPDVDFDKTMEENFASPPEPVTVAVVPDVLNLSVKLELLDELDVCIVTCLENGGRSLKSLLFEVSEAFEEPIDPLNNQDYRQLIFDTLKRMLFNNILAYQKSNGNGVLG